jgi:hypothetical protein
MYKVNLGVSEFHLVFGALQDKVIANECAMSSLVRYENLYDEVIENQEKYDSLVAENKKLNSLLDALSKARNEQLK